MTRMPMISRRWTGMLGAAVVWALALPALADEPTCSDKCASRASAPVAACISQCPAPADAKTPNQMQDYQRCTSKCTQGAQRRLDLCTRQCPKPAKKTRPAPK